MTITIKYDSEFADYSISTYTHEWAEKHGDITEAARGSRKYGEFEGGTGFSGTKYSLPSSHVADTAMIVEGDVTYSFMPQHTFYGKMDSLELGEGLTSNPNGQKSVEKPQPTTTAAPKLSRHMRQILFKVKSHARKNEQEKEKYT